MGERDDVAAFDPPGELPGETVVLEPLAERHRADLRAAAALDEEIWRYFPMGFNGAGADFGVWFDAALRLSVEGLQYPFLVRRREDGAVIGTTRFYDMIPLHRRLAIGSTWYTPDARGSLVNSEVRLLTLRHAFEAWRVLRVELITDPRNIASQAAMKILGAVREGMIRSHLIYKDGRVRDSLLYSIVADEWPGVRERLQARLAP